MKLQGLVQSRDIRAERRQYLRYPVFGTLVLEAYEPCECKYIGVPLNLSLGGILFQADPMPPQGAWGTLQLRLDGLDENIGAEVRIIRSSGSTAVAFFFLAPPELVRRIGLLTAVDIAPRRNLRTVGRDSARRGLTQHSREHQEEF